MSVGTRIYMHPEIVEASVFTMFNNVKSLFPKGAKSTFLTSVR